MKIQFPTLFLFNGQKLILLLGTFLCLQSMAFAQEVGCTTGDCENGKGRFIFKNGDKYIGEFKAGQPDGRGIYTFVNGNVYNGQFKASKRHGYGTYKWVFGDTYKGEYVNDLRHGEGTYYFSNGEIQEGIWKDGEYAGPKEKPVLVVIDSPKVDPFAVKVAEDRNKYKGKQFKALSGIVEGKPRTALVIGNSEYNKNPLKNPVNDAIAITEELQRSGFDVILYTNVSQIDMKVAIRDFGQLLKQKGGVGLFYYAGHGLQADGRNYLVPVDAAIHKVQDIEFESIDLGRVLVEMDYAENALNILILDACRDNPYKEDFKDTRNKYNGLATINSAPYNSFIAFSTAPGAVAMDNSKAENGLYTQELLNSLRQKGLKLEDVFKTVRSNVRKQSNGVQIPWEISSVEDDFYFKK